MSVKKSFFYRQINVLKRVGGHLCKLWKLNVYYSFIMSNFKLLSSRLAFFCGEVNTKKIEKKKKKKKKKKKNQERTLRFIYNDYTSIYESLLIKSQLPSLRARRLRAISFGGF